MKRFFKKTWKMGLTLLFGVAVLLFWGNLYPAHLAYQEQFQLFQDDTAYWWELVVMPGGLADYVGEFFTQFYYYPWVGAALLALLFMWLQRLCWFLMREQGTADTYYPLSFLPLLLLWSFMGDEHVLLSFPIALLMALLAAYGYTRMDGKWKHMFYVIVVLPLLYWSAGSAHFIFIGWLMVREFQISLRHKNLWGGIGMLLGVGLLGILCPLLASSYVQYPVSRLFGGLNYYRFPETPWMEIAIILTLAFISFLLSFFPKYAKRKGVIQAGLLLLVAVGGFWGVKQGCDWTKEEAMQYDRLVREKEWHRIVKMAETKPTALPFNQVCLNLALAKTGQLSDRMFKFYQGGTDGLLPPFQRDFISMLPVSEVYYHLGLINTAQRFTFEAMEAIPNYRKSTRCIKRLAETNLINGNYELAAKYLHLLEKTLFYKEWAAEAMGYLYNEERINNHREYGWLRQTRCSEDFLFGDRKLDVVLAALFQHNPQNTMAYEYLMGYVLQQRDLNAFSKYYALGERAGYNRIPYSYQEALAYIWIQQHGNVSGLAGSLSQEVLHEVSDFMQIYRTDSGSAQSMLQSLYSDTYWYYLIYNK